MPDSGFVNGGIYGQIGGTSFGVTFGSDGVTVSIGGQLSVGYTASGGVGINYNPDSGFSIQPQAMNGVATPTGMPGMTMSWQYDPSGSGIQQIQIGGGINESVLNNQPAPVPARADGP